MKKKQVKINEEALKKNTVDVEPYPFKDEDACVGEASNGICRPRLEDATNEEINDELRERSAKARMQQNVDKAVVGYFKRHGTYTIINSAVAASVHGPCTLEDCIKLFKGCDPAIIDELISLYAFVEQQGYTDARREGFSSACRSINYTKYK